MQKLIDKEYHELMEGDFEKSIKQKFGTYRDFCRLAGIGYHQFRRIVTAKKNLVGESERLRIYNLAKEIHVPKDKPGMLTKADKLYIKRAIMMHPESDKNGKVNIKNFCEHYNLDKSAVSRCVSMHKHSAKRKDSEMIVKLCNILNIIIQ